MEKICNRILPVFVVILLVVSCVPYARAATTGTITIMDYSGKEVVYEIEYVNFPCVCYVTEDNSLVIQESGNTEWVEEYVFSGSATFRGFGRTAYTRQYDYPKYSYFTLNGPATLYLIVDDLEVLYPNTNVGSIEVFDYTGGVHITSLDDVTFPAIVTVTEYGFYATSYGSDVATHFYVFDGLGTFEGLSVLPNETVVRYPIGYTFSMSLGDTLHVILETSIVPEEYWEDNISDSVTGVVDGNAALDALTPEAPEIENDLGLDNNALFSVGSLVASIWDIDGLTAGVCVVASIAALGYLFFGKRSS